MAISITEERKKELLVNFIENSTFYKFRDFSGVREVISDYYHNDYYVFEQVSKTEKSRHLLATPKLLHKIMTEISNGTYEFILDEKSDDIFFYLKQFNLYEDKFITNPVATISLEFLTFIIPIIDKEIVNTEKLESHNSEVESLYAFFKKIISKLNLQKADQSKYQNLFNKIEQLFNFNNCKNAAIWFKFYFLSFFLTIHNFF